MSIAWIFLSIWITIYFIIHRVASRWCFSDVVVPFNSDKFNGIYAEVIVCVRNEEHNITACLESLLQQDIGGINFKISIYNDQSQDQSERRILDFRDPRILYHPPGSIGNLEGKKAAIQALVERSNADIILTADADCIYPADWLISMLDIALTNIGMASGPVWIGQNESFISHFQGFSFAAIQQWAHAGIRRNLFFMPSGASLAYPRVLFEKVGGYRDNMNVRSGDDVFLARSFIREGIPVRSLLSKTRLVTSNPCDSWTELISQYLRWGAKSSQYKWDLSSFIWGFVFFTNLLLLGLLVPLMAGLIQIPLFIIFLLIKFISDYLFISRWYRFFNLPFKESHFIWAFLVYPIFLFLLLFRLVFRRRSYWKEREISS